MRKSSVVLLIFVILLTFFTGCIQFTPNNNIPNGKKIADELSVQIRSIGPIDDSIFDDYSKFKDRIKKINELIIIINENIKTEIPEIGSTISNFEKFKEIKIVVKYSPLIEPYNKLYESAKKLPSDNDIDYEKFYSELGYFSLEIGILQSQLSYKLAYRTTGELAYNLKLYKFVPYIGDEGYKIMLSEIHWSLRVNIENQTNKIINFLTNQT